MSREKTARAQIAGHEVDVRDGMRIVWDAAIEMDDGLVIRADLFLPVEEGEYPVIASYGSYGKNLALQEGFASTWQQIVERSPEATEGSTNKYMAFEVMDPEKWIPHGYAVMRVDARGTGRSPGVINVWGDREQRDFCQCIEWAAAQPWSNGKVGTAGMSYYATIQWLMSKHQPPHLAAMVPWDGPSDLYREMVYHGGILGDFLSDWYENQVKAIQYGQGESGRRNPHTGILVSGDEELSEEERAANRGPDLYQEMRKHPLDDDDYHSEWQTQWDRVVTPFLASGSWGSVGIHLRGITEAYMNAVAKHKWLVIREPFSLAAFFDNRSLDWHRRFFDYFLKGEGNWVEEQPAVTLDIRQADDSHVQRAEQEWPLARTQWTKLYLDPATSSLSEQQPGDEASTAYDASVDGGATFKTAPFEEETEVTGPLACKLWVSSSTKDADLFLLLRLFDQDGEEVLFQGIIDPGIPLTNGWLRASHRKLDKEKSLPYRPYHSHDEEQPLEPGEVYEVDVELWPTSIVIPAGYRLALTVQGKDFDNGSSAQGMSQSTKPVRGSQWWEHHEPLNRPPEVFEKAQVTVYGDGERPSHLLTPFVPPKG